MDLLQRRGDYLEALRKVQRRSPVNREIQLMFIPHYFAPISKSDQTFALRQTLEKGYRVVGYESLASALCRPDAMMIGRTTTTPTPLSYQQNRSFELLCSSMYSANDKSQLVSPPFSCNGSSM